jgi:hypothetical protein
MSDDQTKELSMSDGGKASPMVIYTPNLVRHRRNEELCNNLPVPTTFGDAEHKHDSVYLINTIYKGKDIIFYH